MPNVRDRIRMTDEEAAAFLAEPRKLQLATINADGTPHLVTMYYDLVDGRIAFWTYRTSQKAVNIRRDPRVACLVEAGDAYDTLRGVQVTGTVTTVEDVATVRDVGARVYARYVGSLEGLDGYVDAQARKRVACFVDAHDVVSWDHRKLATAGA